MDSADISVEYYLRLVSLDNESPYGQSHPHDKEYTLEQLLTTAPHPDIDQDQIDPDVLRKLPMVPAGMVLGRQSSAAVEDRYSRVSSTIVLQPTG